MLKVGEQAPGFELPDSGMQMINLSDFRGKKKVVLFFYPRDNMPQSTQEAIAFSDREEDFLDHDAIVLGVSPDDVLCHADFCETHGLTACLLSDVEHEVCRRYDVVQDKEIGGRVRACIDRVTYVIDRDGIVRYAVPATNCRDHALEVLKLVKELN